MSGSVKLVPTIFLKGVSFEAVKEKYNAGEFEVEKEKKKFSRGSNVPELTTSYGKTVQDPNYNYKDRNGADIFVVTSNSKNYEVMRKNGKKTGIERCDFCKADIKTDSIGYPIAYSLESYLTSKGTYQDHHFFWTEGSFCCFEHAFAYTRRFNFPPGSQRDFATRDSHYYLLKLYQLANPNAGRLEPASDPLLTDVVDSKQTRFEHKRTSHITLLPAKVSYIQRERQ